MLLRSRGFASCWRLQLERQLIRFRRSRPAAKPLEKDGKKKLTAEFTEAQLKASTSQTLASLGIAPYPLKKDEAYMCEPQANHFRHILTAWKQQLREEVDRTVHHMQDEAANFPDQLDRAAQEEEFSLELRTRDRERKLLKKIDEALKQIDADEYGYCEQCGVEIGIRRLEARPTASLCIDCKTLAEIKEKQYGN